MEHKLILLLLPVVGAVPPPINQPLLMLLPLLQLLVVLVLVVLRLQLPALLRIENAL